MSKRSASYSDSRKRSRKGSYTIVGYDRAKGGMQPAARGKLLAAMKRAAGGEKKGVDTSLSLTPVIATTNTNASSFVLNLVQQGAGSWNRVGRKINLLSVRLRGTATFTIGPTVTTGNLLSNTMRMVVVWDKQPSGAAIPTFDAVFGKTAQDGTESCTFLDPVRYDNMDRFAILRDVVCAKSATAVLTTGTSNQLDMNFDFDEFVKLGGREVVFSGQSAPMTIADISTGALYVYFRTEFNTASTNFVGIDAHSMARLRYTDA